MGKNRSFIASWQFWVSVVVSVSFLFIALRQLQFADVWKALSQADYLWLVPAVCAYLGAFSFRLLRWIILVRHEKKVSFFQLLPTMAIGRAANNLLPWRLGEGVRVILLERNNGIDYGTGTASLILERISDGISMLVFLLGAALLYGLPAGLPQQLFYIGLAFFGSIIISIYLTILFPIPIHRFVDILVNKVIPSRFRKPVLSFIDHLLTGVASIRSLKTVTLVLLTALMVWICELGVYRLVMNTFHFQITFYQLLLMSAAANLGTAIPSGVANLGTFDTPGFWVLTNIAGIHLNMAGSYMLVLHCLLWVTETGLGLLYMWHTGLNWNNLRAAQKPSPITPEAS